MSTWDDCVHPIGDVVGEGSNQQIAIQFVDVFRGEIYQRTYARPGGTAGGQLKIIESGGVILNRFLEQAGYRLASRILNEQRGASAEKVVSITGAGKKHRAPKKTTTWHNDYDIAG